MIRHLVVLQFAFLALTATLGGLCVFWVTRPAVGFYGTGVFLVPLVYWGLLRGGGRWRRPPFSWLIPLSGLAVAVWAYAPLHFGSWDESSLAQAVLLVLLALLSLATSTSAGLELEGSATALAGALALVAVIWGLATAYPLLPILAAGLIMTLALLQSRTPRSATLTPPSPAAGDLVAVGWWVVLLAGLALASTLAEFQQDTAASTEHYALAFLMAAATTLGGSRRPRPALFVAAAIAIANLLAATIFSSWVIQMPHALAAGAALGLALAYLYSRRGGAALLSAGFAWALGTLVALILARQGDVARVATVLLAPLAIALWRTRRRFGKRSPSATSWLAAGFRNVHRKHPRIGMLAALLTVQVGAFALFRVVFWRVFRASAGDAPPIDWLRALYLGTKFDLRLALWICLPLAVFGAWGALDPLRSRRARYLWAGYFVVTLTLIAIVHGVDLGFYGYWQTRVDASFLDLVAEPAIAAGMLWETYPILPGALLLAVLATAYGWLLVRWPLRERPQPEAPSRPWRRRLVATAAILLYVLGIYGKFSWYPLRWSDAFFGTDPFVSALALNPVLYIADTLPNRAAAYDEDIVRAHYAETARLLGVEGPRHEALSFERLVVPPPVKTRPRNLVVIHLESFSAFKTGAFGNELGATPNFDALVEGSTLFSRFFVPSGPTARSIFTMTTGIPDLNPVRSASRNPRIVGQHMVVNALEDHERFYFLGGSATWGNIRGLMAHNIEDLQIYEEGSYDRARGDVWGISDLDLFEAAHDVLRGREGPFFAFIQTAGNHRPYTLPDETPGFEPRRVDEATLAANLFESEAAFNSLRLLDHALGRFFELAQREPYYADTLFALYGDHGGPTVRSTPWNRLGLTINHVPGVLHAPRTLPGTRIDSVASLVDLLPTALGVMGVPYVETALGRDLLAPRPPEHRFALLSDGLITDDLLLKIDARNQPHLYRYGDPAEADRDVRDLLPGETERLRLLHEGLEATARYLLYHNPPRSHDPARTAAARRTAKQSGAATVATGN